MATNSTQYDVLIVGGGVIGLSLAWELAQNDVRVCVVDRGPMGKEASWAGAGMIPPGPDTSKWSMATPLEQLEGLSQELHREWHAKLLDETGIDSEYRQCGSVHLALTDEETHNLRTQVSHWRGLGIDCQELGDTELAEFEPAVSAAADQFSVSFCLPDESQIRNPRHLRALIAVCQQCGVTLMPHADVHDFEVSSGRIEGIHTSAGVLHADQVCIATGCWSGVLANKLGIELPVRPIRGQIALLEGSPNLLKRILCVGPRYVVPRRDGHILIGSTQEDVGFEKTTTDDGIRDLRRFAETLAPVTKDLPLKTSWAGLRPATPNRQPILGQLPNFDNAWVATGHFRAGLQLSPATAVVMRALMLGEEVPIDTDGFALADQVDANEPDFV